MHGKYIFYHNWRMNFRSRTSQTFATPRIPTSLLGGVYYIFNSTYETLFLSFYWPAKWKV